MSTLDLDAIDARHAIAACEVGDSDSWRSAEDVPALVAEVRRLRADLAAIDSALDGSVVPAPGDSLARRVYERAQSCVDLANYASSLRADLAAMTASRDGWLEIALKRIDERDEVTASALLTEPSRDEMERALGDIDETFACGWTIRRCIDCRTPVAGGPTRCLPCASEVTP